jgi:elongation factor Ts
MQITLDLIKKLRAKTKCGIMDCRVALGETGGDFKKAEDWLRKKGIKSAQNKAERATATGLIEAYSHAEGKIVAMVELLCETDFVARTDDFKKLSHELAMQVAAMNPENVKKLLSQPYIRDEKITVDDLVKELIGKTGENIKVSRIARFALGE